MNSHLKILPKQKKPSLFIIFAITINLINCTSSTNNNPNADPVFYEQIEGGTSMLASISFCEATQNTPHVGIYNVSEIKSIVEQTDYDLSPYTYVTLALLEDWRDAPTDPIARVKGGEMVEDNGERSVTSWDVSIRREKNVILFADTNPNLNNGYYYLNSLSIFPIDEHQMVRNPFWFGQESVPLAELQDLIKKAQEYSGPLEDCPYLNKRRKRDNEPREYQEPESDEEYIILETAD